MTVGDPEAVPEGEWYFADTGMYGTPNYGGVYVHPAGIVVESGIGADRDAVFDALDALDCEPEALLLTHVHLDHAGGAGFLAERYPDLTVYAHEAGARHLAEPGRLVEGTKRAVGDMWEFYAEPEPVPEERIVELTDGDPVELGDRTLRAHRCPGHAPHQVAFHDEDSNVAFVGDAAGLWVPGREEVVPTSPPPQFNLDACLDDLDTLRGLGADRLCYTHFGPGAGDPDAALSAYAGALREFVERVRLLREEGKDPGETLAEEYERRFADVWGARKAREEAKLNVRGVSDYLGE